MSDYELCELRKKLGDLKNKKNELKNELEVEKNKLEEYYRSDLENIENEYNNTKRFYNFELNGIDSEKIKIAEKILEISVLLDEEYQENKHTINSISGWIDDVIDWITGSGNNDFNFNKQRIGLVKKLVFAPSIYENDVSKKFISYECTEPTDKHPIDVRYCEIPAW